MVKWFLSLALAFGAVGLSAKEAVPASADPVLEARMMRVAAELRCLVCQNQTIADSHSGLAEDLRREVREQLSKGASEEQVVQYMTDRYGDFVRYKPPLKASTALLWGGPALLFAIGLTSMIVVLRRRSRLEPDQFEPDEGEGPDAAAPATPGTINA
ncbi:MAG: cytochrome c-type biogenesis protein [Burkholderiaceae bacterium]